MKIVRTSWGRSSPSQTGQCARAEGEADALALAGDLPEAGDGAAPVLGALEDRQDDPAGLERAPPTLRAPAAPGARCRARPGARPGAPRRAGAAGPPGPGRGGGRGGTAAGGALDRSRGSRPGRRRPSPTRDPPPAGCAGRSGGASTPARRSHQPPRPCRRGPTLPRHPERSTQWTIGSSWPVHGRSADPYAAPATLAGSSSARGTASLRTRWVSCQSTSRRTSTEASPS